MLVADARAHDHPIVWANAAFLSQTGYALDEVTGRNCRMLQGAETDPAEVARLREAVSAGRAVSAEILNYRKDGTTFWNALTITPVSDDQGLAYFFASQTDTTQFHVEAQKVSGLIADLAQKTALIHEIDHRAKNNLQVISSLMLLKARRTQDGEARDALEGMVERIGALSIAHRLLYTEEDGSHFALTEFVAELLSDLDAGMADDRIRIDTEVEAIRLPASMAAPLALMIHELVANALRHAFPHGRPGRVSITARRTEIGMAVEICDDGVGFDATVPEVSGFGRSLVEMVAKQLRGTVRWLPQASGTRVDIAIPLRAN